LGVNERLVDDAIIYTYYNQYHKLILRAFYFKSYSIRNLEADRIRNGGNIRLL